MPDELDRLETERARPEHADLDLHDTRTLVRLMAAEDAAALEAVVQAGPEIAAVVDAATDRLRRGGRLIYVGAGSAGRIAALDAAEIAPTFGVEEGLVVAIVAGGAAALADAREGLEDDDEQGAADARTLGISPADTLIGVSASGRTPYVLGALRQGRISGALTISLVNNDGSRLAELAELSVTVRTGPEFIAGSTRLKAGTAQKLVLNTISTIVMVKLGQTYGNWMVGVTPHNEKLRRRARRILAEAADTSEANAQTALAAAGGDTKVALVMLLADVEPDDARQRLAAAGGVVRQAVG